MKYKWEDINKLIEQSSCTDNEKNILKESIREIQNIIKETNDMAELINETKNNLSDLYHNESSEANKNRKSMILQVSLLEPLSSNSINLKKVLYLRAFFHAYVLVKTF